MASRRRQAASVAGAEKLLLTSPARRRNRRRAAVEGAQHGESPCSENRAEERSLYTTPKRTQVSRSRLPTFSSPTNEIDMQQEIFWDPQSPTMHKLGNSQKKLTVGGHTVEISEIVNRIAPQDEKPACYEGSLLGLWIGEDAIPCTPGITKVRSRTKINTARDHRLNHGEELMKLAKQFDKNLIDAVQEQYILQPDTVHVSSAAKLSTDHHIKVQTEDQWQLLNEHPTINTTLSLGIFKENAGTAENPKSSSQKSIDLDAEGALNDLFDCPTQKCSGQLSQGLLNCSLISVVQDKGTLLKAEQTLVRDGPQGQSAMLLKQHSELLLAEKAKTTSVQTISGVELSNNDPDKAISDDNYDWGADLFPDDSLLMQITQKPELMKSAEGAHISEEKEESKKRAVSSKKPSVAQGGVFNPSNTVPVSCISVPNQNIWTEKAKVIPFHEDSLLKTNKVDSSSKNRQNNTLDYNFIEVKSENKNMPRGLTQLESAANTSSPEKRTASLSLYSDLAKLPTGKFKSHVHGTSYQASVVSTNKKPHVLKTADNQGSSGYPKETSVANKGTFLFGDWSEPKFSDEVLELFCDSNTFWSTNCDDDDLLYQVCDDVERKTLSQMGMKETGKAKSMARSTSNLEQSLCQPGPNQGLSFCLPAEKNHAGRETFSLDPPVATRKNENSANMAAMFEGSFASGTGTATASSVQLNINNRQWQNGYDVGKIQTNCNQLSSSEKSKYMFKKTNSSQALALDHKNVNVGSLPRTNIGLWESKNAPNIPFQKVMNGKPVFQRLFSIDFAPSEKEHKSRRCSQEEIARKKQEALERRKCKIEALFKNAVPT